jgi:hypothetical protein
VNIETVIGNVNTWFKENCLSLNIEKNHYVQFKIKEQPTH